MSEKEFDPLAGRNEPFLLRIDNVFRAGQRMSPYTLIVGRIVQGTIRQDERIEVLGVEEKTFVHCTGLMVYNRSETYASVGDNISLSIKRVPFERLEKARFLVKPDSVKLRNIFGADVHLFSRGGRG